MIVISGYPSSLKKPCVLYGNAFVDGTTTYTSNEAAGPNAIDGNTYDAWTPGSLPATISTTLAAPSRLDCLCIAAHTLAATGTTLTLEYYNGTTWVEIEAFSPTTGGPVMLIFEPITATQWRVTFSGGTVPAIGVIALGKRLTMATGIAGDYNPTNWARTVDVLGGDTMGGQFLGQRIVRRGGQTRIPFGSIDREWFDTNAVAFIDHYNDAKPFFYAGGPRTVPNDLAYCWRPEGASEAARTLIEAGALVRLSLDVAFHVAA